MLKWLIFMSFLNLPGCSPLEAFLSLEMNANAANMRECQCLWHAHIQNHAQAFNCQSMWIRTCETLDFIVFSCCPCADFKNLKEICAFSHYWWGMTIVFSKSNYSEIYAKIFIYLDLRKEVCRTSDENLSDIHSLSIINHHSHISLRNGRKLSDSTLKNAPTAVPSIDTRNLTFRKIWLFR